MPSASKTPILGLNQYIGSERLQRLDYNTDMLNIEKYADTINKFREEFKDNTLETFTTNQVITPLTDCVGGMVNIDKIQGKTMYKRANGTVTDTWESGVTLVSVGETIGEIGILTQSGKNLFDKSTIIKGYYYSANGSNSSGSISSLGTQFINVKNGKTYYSNKEIMVVTYDINKNFIERLYNGSGQTNHTFNPNVKFIKISQFEKGLTYLDDLILSETEGIPYEPYKGDKTEILTIQPLRAWDSIDNNGVVNRGSGQIVLNGSENWQLNNTFSNTIQFSLALNTPFNSVIFSDKFPFLGLGNDTDVEHIRTSTSGLLAIVINIQKSKLTTQNVLGFKTWLASTPTTVVYQLATQTTENTNKTLDLTSYQNGNLVVNSGLVNPTLTYTFPKNQGEREFSVEDSLGNIRYNLENIMGNTDINKDIIDLKSKIVELTTTQETSLTLINGVIKETGTDPKCRKRNNVVSLDISLLPLNLNFPFPATTVCYIPEGFRPINSNIIIASASIDGVFKNFVKFKILSTGELQLSEDFSKTRPSSIYISATYLI